MAAGIDALSWLDAAPPANQDLFYVVQAEGLDRPGCGDGPAVLGPTDAIEVGPITDAVAEDPLLGLGQAVDPSSCTQGLELSWDPAAAPGGGVIRYHVHRSTISHDDASIQAALTPPEGILDTTWTDAGSPLDAPLFYVVLAEAVELPGCGDGPSVQGTTDRLDVAPVTDEGAEAPLLSNATGADDDGCAAGVSLSWDATAWPSPSATTTATVTSTCSSPTTRCRTSCGATTAASASPTWPPRRASRSAPRAPARPAWARTGRTWTATAIWT